MAASYIDDGDGCWRQNVLATSLRYWWRSGRFRHQHSLSSKYVTNIEILSPTPKNCHQHLCSHGSDIAMKALKIVEWLQHIFWQPIPQNLRVDPVVKNNHGKINSWNDSDEPKTESCIEAIFSDSFRRKAEHFSMANFWSSAEIDAF